MRDDLLRDLLAQPLDRFVAERNRLSRSLRADGDRETAAWLAGLRRPAPSVWALDQLARREPSRIRALTNLGRRLGGLQARAVQDRAAAREMQELSREVQRAVDEAVRAGLAVLRDAGHGAAGDTALTMANTLRAVLTGDEPTRVALEEGRLLVAAQPDFGFAALPDEKVVAAGAATAAAAHAAEAADREVFERRTEQRRADDRVAELRAQLQSLQHELSSAEADARAAAERVRAAVDAARAARREADRLRTSSAAD